MRVMVTGGAGYIGAHVVRLLVTRGDEVIVVDDLSTGSADRVPHAARLVRLDLADDGADDRLAAVMTARPVDAAIHFAAKKQVAESIRHPAWYFRQNVGGLTNLLMAMEASGLDVLVFSSSAAVYGSPESGVGTESTPLHPINPYGETKLAGEWLCRDAARAWGLRAVSLRYFNVAGAGWPDLRDPGALNLVPIVLDRVDDGRPVQVFGNDYDTRDGTCIRDYVHVLDLAEAHLAALDHAVRVAPEVDVLNVGTGHGSTVLEVLGAVERATGHPVPREISGRRAGDPARLTADVRLVQQTLGWVATRTLDDIVATAWAARQREKQPVGR